MQHLDLQKCLARLGTRALVELIGADKLESIQTLQTIAVRESSLVKLLMRRHGSQILVDNKIRRILLNSLQDPYISYIQDGVYDVNATPEKRVRDQVLSQSWHGSTFIDRVLNIFQLDTDWGPVESIKIPTTEQVEPPDKLFSYQRLVKQQLVDFLIARTHRVLVHMPTGSGKTRTALEAVSDYMRISTKPGDSILWLAHSEELCEQAIDSIHQIWTSRGDSTIAVHRLWGHHDATPSTDKVNFVVGSLQKLHSMRVSAKNSAFSAASKLKRSCTLVLVDEAHKAVAPTYSETIDFNVGLDTPLIGLTATPGRSADPEENAKLVRFFDGNKIGLVSSNGKPIAAPITHLQQQRFLSKIERERINTDVTMQLEMRELDYIEKYLEIPISVLARLAEEPQRNALILATIERLYQTIEQ